MARLLTRTMNHPLIRNHGDIWNIVLGILFIVLYAILYMWITQFRDTPLSIGVFDFFLIAFATYRIIWLVTYDKITDFVRVYFEESMGTFGKTMHSLLICSWCTSMWIALIMTGLYYATEWWWLLILILGVSGVASFIQIVTNGLIKSIERSSGEKRFTHPEYTPQPTIIENENEAWSACSIR